MPEPIRELKFRTSAQIFAGSWTYTFIRNAVYEAFSEAVIGLAEAVLCITREPARQHLGDELTWKYGLGI
jgi:hypothetical protein